MDSTPRELQLFLSELFTRKTEILEESKQQLKTKKTYLKLVKLE